ncbi:MAG TPA: DNA repair protein RecN [Tissierellaceae bacterium]|nr:DNA repair protein RecN [Tissierellaceae bacterium]
MLVEINIKNFAIIDNINVNFTKGLNIITGETGSGKSILVDAIGIILGSRSSKDLIQSGHKKAVLQGVFYLENPLELLPLLDEYNIGLDHDKLLIISKEINLDGPSISKVNGRSINLSMLKNITNKLVDIFGQHEHQSLLDTSKHGVLVDSFGDEELHRLKSKIKIEYDKLLSYKKDLKDLSMDSSKRDREIDVLKFQIEEISEARLSYKDDEELEKEYCRVFNSRTISDSIEEAIMYLDNDIIESPSAIDLINKSIVLLKNVSEYDDNLKALSSRLSSIKLDFEDTNMDLKIYLDNIELDYERLNYLTNRIDLVNKLRRKYGNSIEEILEFKNKSEKRLELLVNYDKKIIDLNNEIKSIEKVLNILSKDLSTKRKDISKLIESQIKSELKELNMLQVDFKVDFQRTKEFTANGYDRIEFLISTNPGESLKSLSKIISGGEMSRIMLAFKNILAFFDKIPTMIFDEIDTGISGRTGQIVGEKILKISMHHQVICISHLPQLAALADSHYVINKTIDKNKTKTKIHRLTENQRVEEMARLIGGVDLTDTTLSHAKEMIEMSKTIKNI